MTDQPQDNLREPFGATANVPADMGRAQSPGSPQEPESVFFPSGADHAASSSSPSSTPGPQPDPVVIDPRPNDPQPDDNQTPDTGRPLFQSYLEPPVRRPVRIPHFGHLLLLSLLISVALGILALGLGIVSYFHLFGFRLSAASATDLKFNLISEAALYLIAFALSLVVFPHIWHKSYFAGLQWNATAVRRRFSFLAGVAVSCFVLAILDQLLLPGPPNAPIEKMMSSTAAAWLMFVFGVTVAPFFEEMFFRGFLLPSLATACDWIGERIKGKLPLPLDSAGHPQWSIPAMAIASLITSLGFAGLHVAQQGHSLGPFLLLVLVSLVLCGVRLVTRSLAASTAVHAMYNFMIFLIELGATGGFRHFDKL